MNKNIAFNTYKQHFFGLLVLPLMALVITGCDTSNDLTADVIVYENDFENGDLSNITGGTTLELYGTTLIGNYNNDGFSLHLNDLPRHEYIYVSFTLYIHDTWDGNSNSLVPDAPDRWTMAVNSGITASSLDDYQGFTTTFSNGPCDGVLCLPQSFPLEYPFHHQPRVGKRRNRHGLCANGTARGGSTEYFVERTFRHDDPTIIFRFYDELFQPNVTDQKCDESWSMDNLLVRAITIN